MVAPVEMAEDRELEGEAEDQGRRESEDDGEDEALRQSEGGHGEIGAEHILHAMRQVDEVHHAEDEGEAGRDQKEQDAELEPVQRLHREEADRHSVL